MIVIGVDTHKRSHTLVALDAATGGTRGQLTIPATDDGTLQALRFAAELDSERVWALEDCRHVSGRLERGLLASGDRVVRVAPGLNDEAVGISVASSGGFKPRRRAGRAPRGNILPTRPLDATQRPIPARVRVQKQSHHRRVIRSTTRRTQPIPLPETVEIHLIHRPQNRPHQMILRQPLHQRRRHQQQLTALTRNEFSSHTRSVLNPADDTDIPTASRLCDRRPAAGQKGLSDRPHPTTVSRECTSARSPRVRAEVGVTGAGRREPAQAALWCQARVGLLLRWLPDAAITPSVGEHRMLYRAE